MIEKGVAWVSLLLLGLASLVNTAATNLNKMMLMLMSMMTEE